MGITFLIIMVAAIAALVVFFFVRKGKEKKQDGKPATQEPAAQASYIPKFKAGDWITDGRYSHHIVRTDERYNKYFFEQGDFLDSAVYAYVDNAFRLWTIRDAKAGDVLFTPGMTGSEAGGITFIFKGIGTRDFFPEPCIDFYCATSCDGFRLQEGQEYMGLTENPVYPATDSQASDLFAAMAAAGYLWDAATMSLKPLLPAEEETGQEQPAADLLADSPDFGRLLGIVREAFRLEDAPVTEGYTYELYREAYSQYFCGRSVHGLPVLLTEQNFPQIKDNVYGEAGDEEQAFLTLAGWLFAMQMAELLPEQRTLLEKKGYELGGLTKDSNLYGWKFRCDPFNMRMVAASIYSSMKGLLDPDTDAMRQEVGGSGVPYTVSELREADAFNVSPEACSYVDLREFMGTAPGPYAPGYKDRSRIGGLPYPDEPRDEYGNLKVDRDTYEYVTRNYNLSQTVEADEDPNVMMERLARADYLHNATVQAIADKDANYNHLFGGPHTVNGNTFQPVFPKEVLGQEVTPSLAMQLCQLVDDVLHIGSAQRCIQQGHEKQMTPPQYGRLRPGCSWEREARRHSYDDDRMNVLVDFPTEENDGNPTGYYDENGEWTHADVHSEEEFNDVMKDELWANSFPSGHSGGIGGVMHILQMLFPSRADLILRAINAFANNRAVARYHWLSDTRQGRFLASCVFPIVCACRDFKERVEKARKCIK